MVRSSPADLSAPAFTGSHMLIDLFDCGGLGDLATVESALRRAVDASGATMLDLKLHHFGPGHGVTGIALLAESHMSIHTWPEHGYAAVDIFLCGPAQALHAARDAIATVLSAGRMEERTIGRGYGAAL